MKPDPFPFLEVDETTLVFAFRYALGRKTTAPFHVAIQLKKHWDRLADWTQDQIQREIVTAISRGDAGEECDTKTWQEILALPIKGPLGKKGHGHGTVALKEFSWSNADMCAGCGRRTVMCVCSHED